MNWVSMGLLVRGREEGRQVQRGRRGRRQVEVILAVAKAAKRTGGGGR